MKESTGTCQLCRRQVAKSAMRCHLESCLSREAEQGSQEVIQLRIESPGRAAYWLDVELKASAQLTSLDSFLRRIWLECCGHLSAFTIGPYRYVLVRDEWEDDPDETSMKARSGSAIGPRVVQFGYEYDFGSTTELLIRVPARQKRRARRDAVRLLARNDDPHSTCSTCEAPAVSVCPFCIDEDSWFACPDHEGPHGDCGDDVWLPVVNSPRMGICGYQG